ncbi:Signal recognition particle core component [Scheffersomyces spartinae]|uniref:Signal recognition particle subunit SRP72 n=1 Tax=Scheffersomyces spartinae TaxID=45513 RepID=A0A9P7VCE2_9ASCO|nr:Signal recognition particle core component [Scheffersomyces spartinae]KAG7194931.1 Signal recognition particle core component [Scheffersomyces spartinae]
MSNSISQAFKALQLNKAESSSEHENIFEVSYEYLSKIKNYNDVKAFQNCLVALINLDKYNKAYELIQKIPETSVEAELVLEIAYVLYKVGKSDQLLDLVNKHQDAVSDGYYLFGIKNILAQNYYKIGKYQQSLQLVQECIRESGVADNTDFAVNERAVISQINFQHSTVVSNASTDLDSQNYDLLFNESLIELSKNNKQKALELLNKAEQLCLEQNMGADKEDFLSELLPIRLNINYIKQRQGDLVGAIEGLNEEYSNIGSISDDFLKLILKLNLYSCQQEQQAGAGKKFQESNLVFRDLQLQQVLNKMNQKLTKFQYHVLMKNNLLAKYLDGTLGSTLTSSSFIKAYLESFPEDLTAMVYGLLSELNITATDLQDKSKRFELKRKLQAAAATAADTKKQFALYILSDYIYKNLDTDSPSGAWPSKQLSKIIQHGLEDGDSNQLIPSVVGCYMSLKEGDLNYEEKEKIVQSLKDRIITANSQELASDPNLLMLYKELGFQLIQGVHARGEGSSSTTIEYGKQILEALAKAIPGDKFISAFNSNDVSQLIDVDQLQANETIEELVEEGMQGFQKYIIQRKSPIHKLRSRKRKPKFSANKIIKSPEDLTLDPERWLPMKVRSYYKPTKKDRLKASHQGAVERQLTPAPLESTTTNTNTNTSSSSSSNKNKKKKKKGKK